NNQIQVVSTTVNCPSQQADVSIQKSGPASVTRGTTLTYSLVAGNAGPGTATSIVVTDLVPSGLVFNASGSDSACYLNGSNVVCDNFSLTSGQSKALALAFSVPSTATCNSTITNNASVTTSATDSNPGNNTSQTVSTTVSCPTTGADLTVEKTGPSSAAVGGTVQYVLTARNLGPDSATNVTVTDAIPSGLTFNAAQSDALCAQNGSNVVCTLSSLASGNLRSFVVTFNIPSSFTCNAQIQNSATISSATTDPLSSNNTSQTVSTTASCQSQTADLSIIKSGPSSVTPGNSLTYTLTASNAGPDTATNVKVLDNIPSGLTFQTSGSDSACAQSGSTVQCTHASLTSGQNKAFTVVFAVPSSQTCNSTITNVATITSSLADANTANNVSQILTTATCTSTQADLSITKSGPSTVNQGGTITYTVTATNAGPGTATNVVIADVVPSGLTFQTSGSDSSCHLNGTSVLCDNFSLASGQSKTVNIAFAVSSSQTCNSTISNAATVSTSATDPNSANNTSGTVSTTVTCNGGTPTYTITKSDSRTSVNAGEALTYTITVTNSSSVNATNVQVSDILPSGLSFVSASDSGYLSGSTVYWTISSLTAGASKTLTLTAIVPSSTAGGTVITNLALVGSVVAQDQTTVSGGSGTCDLSITLTDSRDPVEVDETFTYTIQVRNQSATTATNVSLTQTLDSNVDFLSSGSTSGLSDYGNTIRWDNLTIAGNSTSTFTTTVRVLDGAEGDVIRSSAFACNAQDSENTIVNDNGIIPPPAPPPPSGGTVTIDKQADRSEAQPGSIVSYTITIRNTSSAPTVPLTIEDAFNAGEMTVESADGGLVSGGSIRWDIGSVGAGVTRLITYRVRLNSTLQHGQTVSNTARIVNGASDIEEVHIIKQFPQTGFFGRAFTADTNGQAFLQPVSPKPRTAESSSASLPMILWITLSALGIGTGGLIGKKFFLLGI
ncbi:MAG: DUF11 domain-containing protein, partial [Candidatus Peribacteraceae bacterium]|nr:DUF11 domain-containing protein [Candidatus Peribacteraceae bacterium]